MIWLIGSWNRDRVIVDYAERVPSRWNRFLPIVCLSGRIGSGVVVVVEESGRCQSSASAHGLHPHSGIHQPFIVHDNMNLLIDESFDLYSSSRVTATILQWEPWMSTSVWVPTVNRLVLFSHDPDGKEEGIHTDISKYLLGNVLRVTWWFPYCKEWSDKPTHPLTRAEYMGCWIFTASYLIDWLIIKTCDLF